jgi:hypothetical protein
MSKDTKTHKENGADWNDAAIRYTKVGLEPPRTRERQGRNFSQA